MHQLMYVTITMDSSASAFDVRRTVFDELVNDSTFCGDSGRFAPAICDAFVIGGRWSGKLALPKLDRAYRQAINKEWPEGCISVEELGFHPELACRLDALWQSVGGVGNAPETRISDEMHGYLDDAQPLDEALYQEFLADWECMNIVGGQIACEFVDLDGDCIHPDFIGRKWLAIVDYHY